MKSSYIKPIAAIALVILAIIWLPILQNYGIIPTLSQEILYSIYILLIGIAIYSIMSPLVSKVHDEKSRFLLRKVILAVTGTLVILSLLAVWIQELTLLALSLGLIAAGLTIALQQPIASLVGWIVLAIEKPFSVGDRISINNLDGDVIDYGPFFIKVMEIRQWVEADMYTGRILMIPMNWILSYTVYNYSKDFAFIWDRIWIGLLYGVNFNKVSSDIQVIARQYISGVVKEAEKAYMNIRKKYYLLETIIEPQVFVSFDSNWIQIDLRYPSPIRTRAKIRSELSSLILQYLRDNKITVASTSMNVNLTRAINESHDLE